MISGLIMLLFFLFSFSLIFNLLRQLLVKKKKKNQQQNIAFCSIYLFLLYFQNQSFHTYAGVCCYGVIPQRYLKNICVLSSVNFSFSLCLLCDCFDATIIMSECEKVYRNAVWTHIMSEQKRATYSANYSCSISLFLMKISIVFV